MNIQSEGFRILRPIDFYMQDFSPVMWNYKTHNVLLLAIVETMRRWQQYHEGAHCMILILCDHTNLKYLQTPTVLSQRQARWAESFSFYNFVIQHLEGKKNPADGPSRQPDWKEGSKGSTAQPLVTLAATTVNPFNDLVQAIQAASATD
jgi:hypothetical protein